MWGTPLYGIAVEAEISGTVPVVNAPATQLVVTGDQRLAVSSTEVITNSNTPITIPFTVASTERSALVVCTCTAVSGTTPTSFLAYVKGNQSGVTWGEATIYGFVVSEGINPFPFPIYGAADSTADLVIEDPTGGSGTWSVTLDVLVILLPDLFLAGQAYAPLTVQGIPDSGNFPVPYPVDTHAV